MLDTSAPLISEFLKDHQQFSRLIYQIAKLLEAGEIEKARLRAAELDEVAGPHIAYEEQELYRRLKDLGVTSVTEEQLVAEHHEMRDALRTLLASGDLAGDELEQVKAGFQSALDHAEHCGSLISLMSQLNEAQQAQSLQALIGFREKAGKWTDA